MSFIARLLFPGTKSEPEPIDDDDDDDDDDDVQQTSEESMPPEADVKPQCDEKVVGSAGKPLDRGKLGGAVSAVPLDDELAAIQRHYGLTLPREPPELADTAPPVLIGNDDSAFQLCPTTQERLASLRLLWECQVRNDHHHREYCVVPYVVMVTGRAGIGKTQLCRQMAHAVGASCLVVHWTDYRQGLVEAVVRHVVHRRRRPLVVVLSDAVRYLSAEAEREFRNVIGLMRMAPFGRPRGHPPQQPPVRAMMMVCWDSTISQAPAFLWEELCEIYVPLPCRADRRAIISGVLAEYPEARPGSRRPRRGTGTPVHFALSDEEVTALVDDTEYDCAAAIVTFLRAAVLSAVLDVVQVAGGGVITARTLSGRMIPGREPAVRHISGTEPRQAALPFFQIKFPGRSEAQMPTERPKNSPTLADLVARRAAAAAAVETPIEAKETVSRDGKRVRL